MGHEPSDTWADGTIKRARHCRAQLEQLSQHIEALEQDISRRPEPGITAAHIEALLKARRARTRFFGTDLFADPAWDMLLDAYSCRLRGKQVSVTSLCHAAEVPSTTALRWIATLERKGWLQRRDDPRDGRRSWIELTRRGVATMEAYWQALSTSVLPV